MDKSVLEQYIDLKKEVEYLDRKIRQLEEQLEKLCVVRDTVTGSRPDLTIGPISVKGYPFPDESRKKFILKIRKEKREEKKAELEELVIQAERFIDSVHDSEMRQLLALKYIDDQTWQQVADQMNRRHRKRRYSEDACRMKVERFLKKN